MTMAERRVHFGDHFIRNVINFDTVHFLDNDFSSLFAAVCYAPFNTNQTHTRFYIEGLATQASKFLPAPQILSLELKFDNILQT